MLVRSVGLSQLLEFSGFSVDASAFVDSPVERGPPDWTLSNSREYLLTGIANAVPKTTRQRAGRQAETVVGVGPPGPAITTTRLPTGPAAHYTVFGLPPGEDEWSSETNRPTMQSPAPLLSWRLRTSAFSARGASKSLPKMLRTPSTENLITGAQRAFMVMRLTREETRSRPD